MKSIKQILNKPYRGSKPPHKVIILRALIHGVRVSSMWGARHFIVQTTNRINELINDGVPILDEWHKTPDGVRYKTYYLPDEYLLINN